MKRFQRAQNLPCTGQVDAATWRRLIVVVGPGDHRAAVRAVQASLQQYDEHLPLDGYFSRRMAHVFRKFERIKHLPSTESVDAAVWQRLTDDLSD